MVHKTLSPSFIHKAVCLWHLWAIFVFVRSWDRTPEYCKPNKPVSSATIAWVKSMLASAGIDITKFKAHSTQAASVCQQQERCGVQQLIYWDQQIGPGNQPLRDFTGERLNILLHKLFSSIFLSFTPLNIHCHVRSLSHIERIYQNQLQWNKGLSFFSYRTSNIHTQKFIIVVYLQWQWNCCILHEQ